MAKLKNKSSTPIEDWNWLPVAKTLNKHQPSFIVSTDLLPGSNCNIIILLKGAYWLILRNGNGEQAINDHVGGSERLSHHFSISLFRTTKHNINQDEEGLLDEAIAQATAEAAAMAEQLPVEKSK